MSIEEPTAPSESGEAYRWISVMDIVPGMVLARPVIGGPRNQMTLHIAVGSAITTDMIAQLINKGVECVAVHQAASPDDATKAEAARCHEARLQEIFGKEPNEPCRQLLEALRLAGNLKC